MIAPPRRSLRIAVFPDFAEEGWPSMDLAAEMLLAHLRHHLAGVGAVRSVRPRFRRRATRLWGCGGSKLARDADRVINRLVDYPRRARAIRDRADVFHICDHSYAQLVHALPVERTGVYCHDLDTFRAVLAPATEPRPRWFHAMTWRILRGLQRARLVFHSTMAVRAAIEAVGVVDPTRLVHVPYGVAEEFFVRTDADAPSSSVYLLHVGSCIGRKRIDVLLDVFAQVRRGRPWLRLVQAGGTWTESQRTQIVRLGCEDAVCQPGVLGRVALARLYRQAALVVQPSEAEGFGLPVAEALAAGAVVVASDIPSLREVGGDAAIYCPVGDVGAWSAAVARALDDPTGAPAPAARAARAARYSWRAHAATILEAYRSLACASRS